MMLILLIFIMINEFIISLSKDIFWIINLYYKMPSVDLKALKNLLI